MPGREGFQFPFLIPLKVIGHNTGDFERVVFHLVRKHIPELEDALRPVSNSKDTPRRAWQVKRLRGPWVPEKLKGDSNG